MPPLAKTSIFTVAALIGVLTTTVAGAAPRPALDRAYAYKAEGRVTEAAEAFEEASFFDGSKRQLVALELGYLAASMGDVAAAQRYYEESSKGADAAIAERARLELAATTTPPAPAATTAPAAAPGSALDEAYRAKAEGDRAKAEQAFARAKAEGADAQRVAMELGYLASQSGDTEGAVTHFREAETGADRVTSERARRELGSLPSHVSADAYADAFGWKRATNDTSGSAVVPMARLRAFVRPVLSVPIDLYVSGQATRDTASHGFEGSALPQIYADNYAIVGAGVRAKLFGNHLELFGQAGPAFNLVPHDGKDRTTLDVRGGAAFYGETPKCAPAPANGARAELSPCLEGYAEAVYVNRFDNDVMAFARPRAALGYLVTGPVAWQATLEGRVAKDINGDYWNNLADGGIGQRWRLLAPFRFDLLVSANAGTYFGGAGAPSQLGYVDVRGLATTYVVF